jgi:hypothetical protein
VKLLAETTGAFGLMDLSTGHTLNANRPSVIARSGFIDSRIALGQIVKVADVPAEATDDEFEAFWRDSDGDRDLAVASFLSKFDPEAPTPPVAQKKRGR